MKEQQQKVIGLPEQDTASFDVLVHWMYKDRLPVELDLELLADSHNLAKKFWTPDFHNALMDQLRNKYDHKMDLGVKDALTLWARTEGPSKLRDFILDRWHYDICKATRNASFVYAPYAAQKETEPHTHQGSPSEVEFYAKLVHRLSSGTYKPRIPTNTGCDYHVHPDGKKCPPRLKASP